MSSARFPFLDGLRGGVGQLLRFTTADKIEAFAAAGAFLRSERGAPVTAELERMLVAAGYPPRSARLEPALLAGFWSRPQLDAIADNPAALRGGRALLDGALVEVAPGVRLTGFPAGPLLVIGSGNSLVPAAVAATTSLLASCPVVVRGSRLNQPVLEHAFAALRGAGDPVLAALLEHVHLLALDHRRPEDAADLRWLLRSGPFAAANFWGGRAALDELVAELGHNPAHPIAIPMEPLTGVAVITQRHLEDATGPAPAGALAEAMVAMGQQLCSSPTEAYFVGAPAAARAFAGEVARALDQLGGAGERSTSDRSALRLDRVRDRCEQAGSEVYLPARGDASWTLVLSEARSAFTRLPPDCALPIHDRSGFLELITVPDLEAAAERIAGLPAAPCHREIKQVQTILRLAGLDEVTHLLRLLRPRGGVYRVVPPEHVVIRHALEPLDGQHLLALLTRQTALLGD